MVWYDVFARLYDRSLEEHYRVQRAAAVEALALERGSVVLDAPCGTGQSFGALVQGVGPEGYVFGADLSAGMLRQASARKRAEGWSNVCLLNKDAREIRSDDLDSLATRRITVTRLHVMLGMSVFRDPIQTFESLWNLLAPGGRCVLVDVHNPAPGLQGRLVNWIAQADIRRKFWEPLEAMGTSFELRELPSKPLHGGKILLATALKPREQILA